MQIILNITESAYQICARLYIVSNSASLFSFVILMTLDFGFMATQNSNSRVLLLLNYNYCV